MAFDSLLYFWDPAVSASLWVGDSTQIASGIFSKVIKLPGVPLRGLNLNIVLNSVTSSPRMDVNLYECSTSTGTFFHFRRVQQTLSTTGVANARFHLDKGFPFLKVGFSFIAGTSSGGGFPGGIVRVGMDGGAYGNGNA